jgi:RecA/RadA recombinase
MARGAALAEAIARLEERYGSGVVLPGGEYLDRTATRKLAFGIASLDALTEGGIAAGEPCALVGAASSGALTLALSLVRSAQQAGGEVAWLDASASFDPLAAASSGVDLGRLLVLRADGDELAFCASVVARSSAFVLVVADVVSTPVSSETLATVVARARAAQVPLLVLADRPFARVSIPVVELRRCEWLREGGRLIGWRSEATRAYDGRVASLSFAPLALPPRALIDEGVREFALEAVG